MKPMKPSEAFAFPTALNPCLASASHGTWNSEIPSFHPRVFKVDLLSGKALREPGVAYQCHLAGGKHTCIEKDIEVVPMEKIVTVLPEDTFGISKFLLTTSSKRLSIA